MPKNQATLHSILDITSSNPRLLKPITIASIPLISTATTQLGFVQIVTQLRPLCGGVAQEALRYLNFTLPLSLNYDNKNLFITFLHNYIGAVSLQRLRNPAKEG